MSHAKVAVRSISAHLGGELFLTLSLMVALLLSLG
jgi:hypothetical protein